MSATTLQLPWGKETISLTLPENWRLQGVLEPSSIPPCAAWIAKRAGAGMKVALVIDDASRPTPICKILPAVVSELEAAGVKRQAMALVPAIGVHRPMLPAEVAERAGMDLQGIQTVTHNCDDLPGMRLLGTTSYGTPVWVNRSVADADLVISIGCIEPHLIASFGGGYKNILPGVAGRATIAHNHALNCQPQTFDMVGQPIEKNPMRLDLEEGCRMLGDKVWIVNAILNHRKQIVRVVAGDPIAAHRAGAEVSARLNGVKIARRANVVIADSFPMDQDLRQGLKALANTLQAVRPGGVVITLVRAEEGVGVLSLAERKFPLSRGVLKLVAPLLVKLVPKLKLSGVGEEERLFLYAVLQGMMRATLILYAPSIPVEKQANLVFFESLPTVEAAVAAASAKLPREADVLVFPYGGITYPQLGR